MKASNLRVETRQVSALTGLQRPELRLPQQIPCVAWRATRTETKQKEYLGGLGCRNDPCVCVCVTWVSTWCHHWGFLEKVDACRRIRETMLLNCAYYALTGITNKYLKLKPTTSWVNRPNPVGRIIHPNCFNGHGHPFRNNVLANLTSQLVATHIVCSCLCSILWQRDLRPLTSASPQEPPHLCRNSQGSASRRTFGLHTQASLEGCSPSAQVFKLCQCWSQAPSPTREIFKTG